MMQSLFLALTRGAYPQIKNRSSGFVACTVTKTPNWNNNKTGRANLDVWVS